ncbi:MAG: peptide chain release factor 1, partial [Clostridia bacterium]|nr:peptide chain release factor 1 [Clostridia bacterium]
MLEKLRKMKERYEELAEKLSRPEVIANQGLFRELAKEHTRLGEIVAVYDEYSAALASQDECREMIALSDDHELRELAREELREAEENAASLEEKLKLMLLPKDPNDERNVIIEIRAGIGGDEAALFGATLFRMYSRYAERHNFKLEMIDMNDTEIGGVKEAVFQINGKNAYSRMKFESGVHRVQRVPETESQGRIHTSAATVAVLPEAEDVEVVIDPNDIRVDTYRSSGAGGQHVNKTSSAIRITHIPTGLVVQSQDERSQIQNREKAMRVLKSRLFELYSSQAHDAEAASRRAMVGSGDRSAKIRTYNFPQSRVTDHRIGLTLYKLEAFIDGDMDEMIDALILDERMKLMQAGE